MTWHSLKRNIGEKSNILGIGKLSKILRNSTLRAIQFSLVILALNFGLSESLAASDSDVLKIYVSVQESLAADNWAAAKSSAQELQKLIKQSKDKSLLGVAPNLEKFIAAKDISESRSEFKKVSEPFTSLVMKKKEKDFEVVSCPMAGAKWVQKKGEVANPYYGKEMLTCGEKL